MGAARPRAAHACVVEHARRQARPSSERVGSLDGSFPSARAAPRLAQARPRDVERSVEPRRVRRARPRLRGGARVVRPPARGERREGDAHARVRQGCRDRDRVGSRDQRLRVVRELEASRDGRRLLPGGLLRQGEQERAARRRARDPPRREPRRRQDRPRRREEHRRHRPRASRARRSDTDEEERLHGEGGQDDGGPWTAPLCHRALRRVPLVRPGVGT